MSDPYVSVTKRRGKPIIQVRLTEAKHLHFPLTKAGCLEAGRKLHQAGAESWMNSSSVDFPQEVKPGFRWDVRELMGQGFQEEEDKKNAPKYSMYKQLMAFADKHHFGATLSLDELAALDELKAHIAELTKGK